MLKNINFAFFKKIIGDIFCRFEKSVYLCTQKTSRDGAVVARWAHNPKVAGSSPAPATKFKVVIMTTFFYLHKTFIFVCMKRVSQYISEIKGNSSRLFSVGVIAFVTIAHVVIYLIMPYTCDDYWYMTPLRDYFMGIDPSFPATELWNNWVEHYQTDNIRFSNIVFSLFLLLPKIIPSIISGLFVGAMLILSAKISGINSRNPLMVLLLTLMISFMLPWYEQMFSLCFSFNYIWASALALYIAHVFFIKKRSTGVVTSLLLGVILGAWHEGFSLPLLGGFVVYLLSNSSHVNRSRIAIILGLVLGLLWLISAPGLQINVEHKTKSIEIVLILKKIVLYHIPYLILIFSTIVALIKRSTRCFVKDSMFIALCTISTIGVSLNLVLDVGVRTGWMGYLFAIIATIYLWKNIKNAKYCQVKSRVKHVLAIAIALFLSIHYIIVIHYGVKVNNEFEYVLEEYEKSEDGVVFADVTYDYQVSPLAWKKPYFENFTYTWVAYWIDQYYNCGKKLRVIPTCLSNAESLRGEKVEGDNPFMIYQGFLYAPINDNSQFKPEVYYEIDFGHTKKVLMCSNFKFTTERGKNYYFSFPQRATVPLWFGKIKSINAINGEL